MKKHFSPRLLAAATAMAVSAGASAQLEEVIVTAQKRSESAQDVPIAITAFSQTMLDDRNIRSVTGLSNYTPNVTLDGGSPFSGTSAVLTAFVRGIGQDDFAFNLDPGVGVYLDGVYLARTVGANMDLLDVERIEVLKGPQGTLFGRNSVGGAISIVTRTPGEELGGRAEVVVGKYDRMDVRGTVDIPIAEDLLSSWTFSSVQRDGYVKRRPWAEDGAYVEDPLWAFPRAGYASSDTEGSDESTTARVKFLWNVNDDLSITATGDYQKIDQQGMANTLLDVTVGEDPGELFGTASNLCKSFPTEFIAANIDPGLAAMCGPRGTIGTPIDGPNADADPSNDRLIFTDRFISNDIDKSYATGPSYAKVESWGTSATIDWQLSDSMQLKSITGYRDLQWDAASDVDGSPVVIVEPGFHMNQDQFSQEFQLLGQALDDRLDYVAGLYYFTEEGYLHDYVPFADGLLQIDGPNWFDTESWAAFTHLNYSVTDALKLTFGARYTQEDKKFEGGQRDPNGFLYKLVAQTQLEDITPELQQALGFPDPNDPLRFYVPGWQDKSFDNFSVKVGAEYFLNDDTMVYASFAQGYKTGGWTTRLSFPLPYAPGFDEEEADTYEVGFKSELLDRTLRVNMAAFYTEYDGIQLTQTEGISPTTVNGGEAEIKGLEGEFTWAPIDGLTIAASFGYIDAEYTEVLPGVVAGDSLTKTPEWKFNLNPMYEIRLANEGTIILNADYTYIDELYNDAENTAQLKREASDMLNASIAYRDPSEKWTVTAGGTNLLDERYVTTGQNQHGGGIIYGTYNRPTEWYLKLGYEF